jgi:cysteinyl-tRNA synthetase
MNLTDVDDKTIKGAAAAGVALDKFTRTFSEAFFDDRNYLRILPAHAYPTATGSIPAMVRMVEGLMEKGVAYRGDDGSVYFAIAKFPAYGKRSRLDTRELKAGAGGRTSEDEYAKEDARDFVLWKAARPEDEAVGAAWDAPFGRGRPGWHLECSAMALDLIGGRMRSEVLDIHAGGIDLVFPHHEDEIAQSCAFTGQPEFARFWMHGEFLTMAGTKMSKRFGNILTARDLREERVDAAAVRLLLFQTHYRQKLDFTDQALEAAGEGVRRLGEFDRRLEGAPQGASAEFSAAAAAFATAFRAAMDEDLNAPQALAAVFTFVREANRLLDAGAAVPAELPEVWNLVSRVLDVLPTASLSARLEVTTGPADEGRQWEETPPDSPAEQEGWARHWAGQRMSAKLARDFATADRLRQLLHDNGFEVRDRKDGVVEVVRR